VAGSDARAYHAPHPRENPLAVMVAPTTLHPRSGDRGIRDGKTVALMRPHTSPGLGPSVIRWAGSRVRSRTLPADGLPGWLLSGKAAVAADMF
jgi:hypothetical protein